jgi:hypothetical protein
MSNLSDVKKPTGRPPVDSEAVTLRLQREQLDALDAWRAAQSDNPGRPEAVRRLLALALDSR